MITTYHSLAFHNQMKSEPWTAEELFDFDLPGSTDDSASEESALMDGAGDLFQDRDQIVNHLRHLTISSLSSYQEIASTTTDPHLKSFAEVVVRQRTAQQRSLYDLIGYLAANEDDEASESLAALRSLWRGAIWNLQEGHYGLFLEYAERAEALLEESYLLAAKALANDPFAQEFRNYAVMICGARAVIEELADDRQSYRTSEFADRASQVQFEEPPAGLRIAAEHPKMPVAGGAPKLHPKRPTKPLAAREGKRRDWTSDRAPRLTTVKPVRSDSRSTKVGRH